MSPSMIIEIAALTNRGKVREHNEDCIGAGAWLEQADMPAARNLELALTGPGPVVCVVADGMGGHAAGEVASRYVVEQLLAQATAQPVTAEAVTALLRRLNEEVFALSKTSSERMGMGTTVAGVVFTETEAVLFNVGDSRIYEWQGEYLDQQSTDHIRGGSRHGDSAVSKTGVITQALGGSMECLMIDPAVRVRPLRVGRSYLLATDGLTDMLSIDDMEAAMGNDLVACSERLFRLAMEHGGKDNISVVLARVGQGEVTEGERAGAEDKAQSEVVNSDAK